MFLICLKLLLVALIVLGFCFFVNLMGLVCFHFGLNELFDSSDCFSWWIIVSRFSFGSCLFCINIFVFIAARNLINEAFFITPDCG